MNTSTDIEYLVFMRPNTRDNVQTAGQNKPSEGDQDPDTHQDPDTEQRGLKCL